MSITLPFSSLKINGFAFNFLNLSAIFFALVANFLSASALGLLCRIEPENNIDMILEAFSNVPNVDLILIGNWKNSNYGIEIRKKYEKFPNLKMLDPIYEQKTLDELRSNCGLYVHGHSVGGTNPSLVEAMNLGLNIIAFNVDYNIETTESKAHYFNTSDDIVDFLLSFYSKSLYSNGKDMLEIARRRYKWSIITNKYADVFLA